MKVTRGGSMQSPLDEARQDFERARKQGIDVTAKAGEYLDVACEFNSDGVLDNEGLKEIIAEVKPYL